MDQALGGRITKRCSQYCYKNLFGQLIENDTKAFQSPLKCSYLTFRGQHSSRESHTYFNMIQPIWGRKMYMGTHFQML